MSIDLIILDTIDAIGTFIIGVAMLIGLFYVINQERATNKKPPLGCVASVVVVIVVLIFWYLMSKI